MTYHVTTPEAFPSAFEEALNAGDLERLLALYDPEAALRGQAGEVRSGPDAIAEEMGELVAARARITNSLRHTLRHDDTALILVDYVLKLDAPSGQRVELTGTATNVIRQDVDGGWRMIIANPQGAA